MRIRIEPTGEVVVDTDDAAQAAAFIKAIRNGGNNGGTQRTPRESQRAPRAKQPKRTKRRLHREDGTTLSWQLTESWNWLVANDQPEGRTAAESAAELGLTNHAAAWRFNELRKKGIIHRVQPGHYRPGEENGE